MEQTISMPLINDNPLLLFTKDSGNEGKGEWVVKLSPS